MKPPFGEIVDKYINLIYFFARRWARNEDVDDMVQNTFLKAVHSYNNFQFQSDGQLKSWLLTICRNTIIDKGRLSKLMLIDPYEIEEVSAENTGDELLQVTIKKDEAQRIISALSKMPSADQEIVKLRVFEEMGFEEIGHVFNITEAAAKMRFYRTIQKLRGSL